MNLLLRLSLALCLFTSVSTYAGTSLEQLASQNKGKSLAIVSLSANNWANSLQGWNNSDTSELMGSRLNTMLEKIESKMGEEWKVIPASKFVNNKAYQAMAGTELEVKVPNIKGKDMPLLAKDRKQMVKAQLDKDVAVKLAKTLGADFTMVIYSEWAVATGKFVPTSKALAKNVVSIYDAKGKQVYKGRSDQQGNRKLGAMGRVAVNKDTIDEWVVAYQKGLEALYNKGRKN
ncbi:hypothetical protein [Teredinibacter sp. KSP-S5-2]|uniref:hypothetical protein n=1 Tax=Teredinibacter sp. KSP-S5-2 TaxID=3034506 RepID=UPI0029342E46|nr:hypothetical protein [Teredinibacter sp. KSP-S5-2]WNO09394.1 hypothetical protein P5V12_20850 [Teredinibacter sp. KSP-S5-2]